MSTKHEQVIAAIKAKLTSVTGVDNSNIFRSRVDPFARDLVPAISVYPLQTSPLQNVVGLLDWTMIARVDVYVRGKVPDQVADPIIESIHSKVLSDLTLGGLTMDIQPDLVKYDLSDGDQPIGIIEMNFRVLYRTNLTNLSS